MSAAARLTRRPMADRSIRILVSPTPVTFAERRSILQVLEQYGPIETFKMTPDYHSNFISVTKESSTATKLVSCSPLSYQAPEPQTHPDINVAGLADLDSIVVHRPSPSARAESRDGKATPASGSAKEGRNFTLEIFPAPDYEHKYAMARSPLQHSWPDVYRNEKSFAASALRQSLPRTISAEGLANWQFDEGTRAKSESKVDRLQLKTWLPGKMKGPI